MYIFNSNIISIRGVVESNKGGRAENQDDFAILDTPMGVLAIVCDGMGGGPGGKLASHIVKTEFITVLNTCTSQTSIEYILKIAVAQSHAALKKKMLENPTLEGMGSTLVALLINPKAAYIVHVGDSRCYKFHNKKLKYRSKDHSLVAELVSKKVLSEEEARLSPQSNVITRGLGSTSNQTPEIEEIPYVKGDRFILCTDGIWGSMPHKILKKHFTQKDNIEYIVSNLSQEVDTIGYAAGGNHDNHTVAILEIHDTPIPNTHKYNLTKKIIKILLILIIAIIGTVILFINIYKKVMINNSKSYEGSDNQITTIYPASNQSVNKENNTTFPVSNNIETILIQEIDSIETQKSIDSTSKKISKEETKEEPSGTQTESIDKIIKLYKNAQGVKTESSSKTVKNLEMINNQIKKSIADLQPIIEKKESETVKKQYNKIKTRSEQSFLTSSYQERNGNKFTPTPKAIKCMEKQIDDLTQLKQLLDD